VATRFRHSCAAVQGHPPGVAATNLRRNNGAEQGARIEIRLTGGNSEYGARNRWKALRFPAQVDGFVLPVTLSAPFGDAGQHGPAVRPCSLVRLLDALTRQRHHKRRESSAEFGYSVRVRESRIARLPDVCWAPIIAPGFTAAIVGHLRVPEGRFRE
jgi:hypothetical protein